jgi:hypothetical protein
MVVRGWRFGKRRERWFEERLRRQWVCKWDRWLR